MEKKSVFISYSSRDQRYVQKIVHMLDKMEISYWVAPDMIPPGSSYAREIPRAIKECEIVLLVLSAEAQESIWVEKEIDSAILYRKKLVPFQIDDAAMNDTFRFYLNNVQTIHSVNRAKEAIRELKERLRELIPEEKTTASEDKSREREQTTEPERKSRKNNEGFQWNRIPVVCQYCGESLQKISRGVYQCTCCGRENYDDLKTVQNYLESNGAKSALAIEKDTGVSRRVIEHFLTQGYLEIPKLDTARLSCQRCGAPIRSGTLCDRCKYGNRRISANSKSSWRSSKRG